MKRSTAVYKISVFTSKKKVFLVLNKDQEMFFVGITIFIVRIIGNT